MTTATTNHAAARNDNRFGGLRVPTATGHEHGQQLFANSTAAQVAAAHRLLAECPALLDLKRSPGLPSFDPAQALALHDLLSEMQAAPKVLEIGHGPWAAILAVLTKHHNGAFWSTGIDAWRTRSLAQQLKDAGADEAVHLSTTKLAAASTLGMEGRFPDLTVLGNEADFNLVFVSADQAVREAASVLHAMPAVASKVSLSGFKLCVNGESEAMQEVAASTWGYLAEDLDFIEGGCAGLGLVVSAD